MRLVITGGGTGGHIFAGIAIAQEHLGQSKANHVLFVGSEVGLETTLVPRAGYKLETLSLGKLVGQSFLQKFFTLIQIPVAIAKSVMLLRKFKADMVVGVGGYAAGPCICAARLLGLPIGVLEQNAKMGFTNRISAKLADFVFTAFPVPPSEVPASKCVFSGNPVRNELRAASAKTVKPFVVFIFGGSQGALKINQLMLAAARELTTIKSDLYFYHQTGKKDFQGVLDGYREINFPASVFPFIEDMQSMYNKAALVICRAGSSTISELGATQNTAIFIPFPFAAGNHQEHNARLVEKAGAAKVLLEGEADGVTLAKMIREAMQKPQELERARSEMAQFYQFDAAQRIVNTMKTFILKRERTS